MKEIILTGIRSNDEPTLGNYLGAFQPMVELQRQKAGDFQLNMFVPDLHSFITPIDHNVLYSNTIKNLKYFVAAGLDIHNKDTFIYRQSYVPAHSELAWILDCFTYFGEMNRMTQFKDKSKQLSANDSTQGVSVGLFNYPVLMAADVLLYGASWVPVGDDQKQHLEIMRDIAIRMNHMFGDIFVVPHEWKKQLEFMGIDDGLRIRSLSNPDKKMSKSVSDPRGTILLSDDPSDAAKKIMSATTDNVGAIHYDWANQPGITNLLQILAHLTATPQDSINATWHDNESYGDLKRVVAESIERFLSDFQTKLGKIDQSELLQKIERDEVHMNTTAAQTLLRVQRAVGLRPKV